MSTSRLTPLQAAVGKGGRLAFRVWLESQPSDRVYDMENIECCALGRWLSELLEETVNVDFGHAWTDYDSVRLPHWATRTQERCVLPLALASGRIIIPESTPVAYVLRALANVYRKHYAYDSYAGSEINETRRRERQLHQAKRTASLTIKDQGHRGSHWTVQANRASGAVLYTNVCQWCQERYEISLFREHHRTLLRIRLGQCAEPCRGKRAYAETVPVAGQGRN